MWIKKVELKDIKSYSEAQTVSFEQGVNAICGPNGAGKSTILEAVGLALFDASPYRPLKQFVREGAKRGEVVVTFVDTLDEREYQVVRPVGSGTPYIYDPETKGKLTTGKANVMDWLKEHLRVEPTADLKALFTNAIGVPQGLLTAPFLERADLRKKKFDQLLLVDDYKKASKELAKTTSYVDDQRQTQAKEIARLKGQLERLPSLEQEDESLHSQMATDKQELTDTTTSLKAVSSKIEMFDQLKSQQEKLLRQRAGVDERLRGVVQNLADAEKAVQKAKAAKDVVTKAEPGHQAYKAAQARFSELQVQRSERDILRKQLSGIERELARVDQAIANHRERLADITEAEAELAELAPQVAQQEQLEKALRQAERDVIRLQNAQALLDREKDGLARRKEQLAEVQAKLEERQRLEQEVEILSSRRERQYEALRTLTNQLSGLKGELAQADKGLKTAEEAAWQWEQAQRRLQEAETELANLQAKKAEVVTQLQRRHEVEATLDKLEDKLQQQQQEQADLKAEKPQLQAQHTALAKRLALLTEADEAECPVCQQTLTSERTDELAAHYHSEQQTLTKRQRMIGQRQKSLVAERKSLTAEQRRLNRELNWLPHPYRKDELSADIKTQQANVRQWHERVVALSDAPAQAESARTQCEGLNTQIQALEEEQTALNQSWYQLGKRLTAIQTQIGQLPRPEREPELDAEINRLEVTVVKSHERVEALRQAPKHVTSLRAQLAELGNPRQKQQRLKARVEERPSVEKRLTEAQIKQSRFQKGKRECEDALLAYADLDEALQEQQAALSQHQSDHQRYLSYQQLAQTLPERQARLAKFANRKHSVENEREGILADLATVQANYDAKQHQALSNENRQLVGAQAELKERLRHDKQRLAQLEEEITDLREVQTELMVAEQKEQEWAKLSETMTFIRKTIREAGPYITRRLVQLISMQANQIFGDIMDDHTMELEWTEEYAINVTYKGQKRAFQQLSGGEQMTAALSVRLALLREMSDIRLAFFDEPTAHLDRERRENLSAQITRIKGFNQLFVISHDDTFEGETHHVLRVHKENGYSQVVAG